MRSSFFVWILSILAGQALSSSVSFLLDSGLDSSNENSLTHHTFKRRDLISEQKLLQPQPETRRQEEIENLQRVRRSGLDDIGMKQVDPNAPHVKILLDKGLARFSRNSKSPNEPFLIKILGATVEKAAGLLYKFTVRLGESTCPKGTKENCQLKENSEQKTYLITILSRPAIDHGYPKIAIQELPDSRRSVRGTKHCVGCPVKVDPNDPQIRQYAEKGVAKLTKTSKSPNEPILIKILAATEQVVSGVSYKIKIQVGESTCPKGTKENCQLKKNSKKRTYLITVLSQPWLDGGNPEVNIRRQRKNGHKVRRSEQLLGGLAQKDPNDP